MSGILGHLLTARTSCLISTTPQRYRRSRANVLDAAKQSADSGAAMQEARETVSQLAARF
jgi:hypothetical protein